MAETEDNQLKMKLGQDEALQAEVEHEEMRVVRHPLLIDVVLKTLFKLCVKPEEVKRNRLVCRTWLDASEAQWNAMKMLIVFQTEEEMGMAGGGGENCMTLQQIRRRCESGQGPVDLELPYRKFKLYGWNFTPWLDISLPNQNEEVSTKRHRMDRDHLHERWFWETIAPSLVTELTLDKCKFHAGLPIFQEAFLRLFPHLEKLTVWDCTLDKSAAGIVRLGSSQETNPQVRMKLQLLSGPNVQPRPPPPAAYQHQNLKHITLKCWNGVEEEFPAWMFLLKHVPKLEYLRIRGPEVDSGQDWHQFLRDCVQWNLQIVAANLKHLDILDFSSTPFSKGVLSEYDRDSAPFPSLEVLKCDMGHDRGSALLETRIINQRMSNLRVLHLYQAPLEAPLQNFLSNVKLENLRELYLWGVFSATMEFLNAVPSLQVLVWVTSAYDEEHQGRRLFKKWLPSQKICPLRNHDFVGKSAELPLLLEMTKLGIDWETTFSGKLHTCMPNLTRLKIKVSSHEQVQQFGRWWKRLEYLELAHGSLVKGSELIDALTEFENLKKFVWKGCPCTQHQMSCEDIQALLEYESVHKTQLPSELQFPWHPSNKESENAAIVNCMCIRGKYEKALLSEDPTIYTGK